MLLAFLNLFSCCDVGSSLMRPPTTISRPIAAVGAVPRSWNQYNNNIADSHLVSSTSAAALSSEPLLLSGGMAGGLRRAQMNVVSPTLVGPVHPLMQMSASSDSLMANSGGYINDMNLDPVMAGFHCANTVLPASDGK